MLFINLVVGFVREEKNVAFNEHFSSLSFISLNLLFASFSFEKACTVFSLPRISSICDVCSAFIFDLSVNIACVFLAIKRAVKSDIGVKTATTAVIAGLIMSMNMSVTAIVITPVKSCEKPISSPSPN